MDLLIRYFDRPTDWEAPVRDQPPPTDTSPETSVRALLAMAGVAPSEAEIADLVAGFAGAREMVASLYEMTGVRYAEPAVTFRARTRGAGAARPEDRTDG